MKSKPETLYKEIQPALEIFEMHRQEADKKSKGLHITLITIGVIIFVILLLPHSANFAIRYVIGFVCLISLIKLKDYYKKRYLRKYLKDIVQIFFGRKNIQGSIDPFNFIKGNHFRMSGLFRDTNRYSGKNLIKGFNEFQTFTCSQLIAASIKGDEGDPANDIVFEGFYYISHLKKDTKSTILIKTKDFRPYRFFRFPKIDESFKGLFEVKYDKNKINQSLSAELIDKLVKFKKKHRAPFAIKIQNDLVYLAISKTHDLFPVSFTDYANQKVTLSKLEKGCGYIIEIIEIIDSI